MKFYYWLDAWVYCIKNNIPINKIKRIAWKEVTIDQS